MTNLPTNEHLAEPPDASLHAALAPDERTRAVLRDLYRWYRAAAPALRSAFRDAVASPAQAETFHETRAMLERAVDVLLCDRGLHGRPHARAAAPLGVVLQFTMWESLAAAGLDDDEAAAVAAAMARAG